MWHKTQKFVKTDSCLLLRFLVLRWWNLTLAASNPLDSININLFRVSVSHRLISKVEKCSQWWWFHLMMGLTPLSHLFVHPLSDAYFIMMSVLLSTIWPSSLQLWSSTHSHGPIAIIILLVMVSNTHLALVTLLNTNGLLKLPLVVDCYSNHALHALIFHQFCILFCFLHNGHTSFISSIFLIKYYICIHTWN